MPGERVDERALSVENGRDDPENVREDADGLAIYAPVYNVVRSIPAGKVMTYGQVADSVQGISLTARQVGTAMRYAPDNVPWQRVVGAGGTLPIAKMNPELQKRQRRLLEAEGVPFTTGQTSRIDMLRAQWLPYNVESQLPGLFDE